MGKTKFFPYKEVSILLPVHNGVRQVPTMQPSLVLHNESCNLETSASAYVGKQETMGSDRASGEYPGVSIIELRERHWY